MIRRVCPTCGYRYKRTSTHCAIDGSALEALDDPMRGALLAGRYRIGTELGGGAMAVVYEARDEREQRTVAIKVPDPDVVAESVLRERFVREGRTGMSVQHPGIARTYDVGCDGSTHYLVMERLRGETLASRIARGALPIAEATEIARQVADALDALHRAGIVHRDIKSTNLFLVEGDAPDRRVRILDLGVAYIDCDDPLTVSRAVLGSARTMSPEQVRGERASAQSDLYSLGVVLFEMLTGSAPFRGNDLAIRQAHLFTAPPSLRTLRNDVGENLDEIVSVMLAKDASRRPVSAAVVCKQLSTTPEGATVMVQGHGLAALRQAVVRTESAPHPQRLDACITAMRALTERWNELSPALESVARRQRLQAQLRQFTLSLAQIKDGSSEAHQVEMSMALVDDALRDVSDVDVDVNRCADELGALTTRALDALRALAPR
jgi:Protein kinase domain